MTTLRKVKKTQTSKKVELKKHRLTNCGGKETLMNDDIHFSRNYGRFYLSEPPPLPTQGINFRSHKVGGD